MITIDDDQQWPTMISNDQRWSTIIVTIQVESSDRQIDCWPNCSLRWVDDDVNYNDQMPYFTFHLTYLISSIYPIPYLLQLLHPSIYPIPYLLQQCFSEVTSSILFLTCFGEVTSSTYPLIHSIRWARPTFCSWQTLWRPSIGSYRLAECTFPSRVTLMWLSCDSHVHSNCISRIVRHETVTIAYRWHNGLEEGSVSRGACR